MLKIIEGIICGVIAVGIVGILAMATRPDNAACSAGQLKARAGDDFPVHQRKVGRVVALREDRPADEARTAHRRGPGADLCVGRNIGSGQHDHRQFIDANDHQARREPFEAHTRRVPLVRGQFHQCDVRRCTARSPYFAKSIFIHNMDRMVAGRL